MMDIVIVEENIALRSELARLKDLLQQSKSYNNELDLAEVKAENIILKSILEMKNDRIKSLYVELNELHNHLVKTLEILRGL